MDMLVTVLTAIAIISTIASIFAYIKVIKVSKRLSEITELYNSLETMSLSESNTDGLDIHTQSFIKFLSDSREMAFEYIDNSQKQIKEFIEIADKQFAFFDSWGILSEGQLYYENMKIISDEYKKLKSLLPEGNE